MIGFQFYAAGTFQFLIILVQGSILFAKGANRSEHFARRLTLDLLGLFLISLPLTLGYWRIDQAAGSAVLSNLAIVVLYLTLYVDRRDAEAMLSAILPILFDGGCDRLRLPTHFLRDPFDRECVPQAGCRSLCCRGLARWILGFIFSGACHG